MATNRLVLYVAPDRDDEGWTVAEEGGGAFSASAATKAEAEALAKEHARNREPSQVRVHKSTVSSTTSPPTATIRRRRRTDPRSP